VAKTPDGVSATEHKIEEFAEDVGRLLGTAQAKAEDWLGQRKQIAKTLEGIRDTATNFLSQLGHQAAGRRGRPLVSEVKTAALVVNKIRGAQKRVMSAVARAKISAAQKARWAKVKAGEKKR
jgi:hypothetical protein